MGYIGIAFGLLIAVAGWAATFFSLSEEGKTAAKYSIGFGVAITIVASIFAAYDHRAQQRAKFVFPGKKPSPRTDVVGSPQLVKIHFFNSVFACDAPEFIAVGTHQRPVIWIRQRGGKLKVSAIVHDQDGKAVCQLLDNEVILGEHFRSEKSDSTLTVFDKWNNKAFIFDFLNDREISIRGNFFSPSGMWVTETDTGGFTLNSPRPGDAPKRAEQVNPIDLPVPGVPVMFPIIQ